MSKITFTTKRTWGISTKGVRMSIDGGEEFTVMNKERVTVELSEGRHDVAMTVIGEIESSSRSNLDVDSDETYMIGYASIKCLPYLRKSR